ncbi:MAG: ectonucleotide pyrophosphatase/phosphodiesterase [Puia sp.]|nr:ectonucleotide pyrophosphatase/phosphodiesterase [Puia sp.]
MRKLSCIYLALLLAFTGNAQLAGHVVLITIDGFRPDFYLDPSWKAVNIRNLMQEGAHADGVNSVFPSMTYPSHTTIVTGVQPAKHGIYYNRVFEPTGPTGKIYWNDSSIKVPTIWEAASRKGLKVAVLLWPVAAGAPAQYVIPDNADMGDAAQEAWSKPQGFTAELRQQVFGAANKIDYGKDQNVARIAAYLIQKDQPNLMTIHFFSVDHYEHMQGRDGDRVRAAVLAADSAVGIIIGALKNSGIWNKTVLIVTGDHGFLDVKTQVSPNVWLVKAGLITDVKKDLWKAQFNSVGGSSYLYLKDRNDKKTLERVRELLDSLPGDQKNLFRIVGRRQMESIGGNPEVAFALTGLNGASFDNAFEGEAVRSGQGGTHGYFPDFQQIRTGFVAAGPGIVKGGSIGIMNLRDIAPALARILGLSFPSAEGKIPAGLFYK